jgi:hypothetical protein
MSAAALVLGGLTAQASGILNTPAGGYLVCVDTKTGAVTHPGTSKCKKGQKRLILGAQGRAGVAGAAGANGQDGLVGASGLPGKAGNTLWSGNGAPASTLGIPGDSYLDLAGKKIHSPKAIDGTWPDGISIVGPQGPQGPGGSGPAGPAGTPGPAGAAGISAPVVTGSDCIDNKCTYKVGDTGPGGGVIFFVDYHDVYEDFKYLEIANPGWAESWGLSYEWEDQFGADSETARIAVFPNGFANDPLMEWCDYTAFFDDEDNDDLPSVGEVFFPDEDDMNTPWLLSAVGRGKSNSNVALENVGVDACQFGAVKVADEYVSNNGTNDWFLPSIGELMLAYTNMRQLGYSAFVSKERSVSFICTTGSCTEPDMAGNSIEAAYWSSTLSSHTRAFHQHFDTGVQTTEYIGIIPDDGESMSPSSRVSYVRPIRSFGG